MLSDWNMEFDTNLKVTSSFYVTDELLEYLIIPYNLLIHHMWAASQFLVQNTGTV